ncbi:MAG: LysR family transcriptional regulator [Opitutaceae bacterium]|nr:LysR family transcriptional regulator [Verrucomicrobiales bacterium]
MDFPRLRSFVAVAEELSFRRAAERLHLSQPPLSRQIKALEEELGVRLLERNRGSRVCLTEAGKSFLSYARQALATAIAARGRAQDAARDARSQLKLGNIAGLSTRVLPPLLRAYRQHCPQVEVSLLEMNRPMQLAALREGQIHAGIFPDLGAPLDRHFQSMPLYTCPMVAVLPFEHALAKDVKASISVNQLAGQTLLIASPETSPGYVERLDDLCLAANFTPTTTHPVEGAANLLGMVAAGYGVAILPEVVVTSSVHTCQTRRLRAPVPPFRLKLLWLRDAQSPLLQNFLGVVKRWANEAERGL